MRIATKRRRWVMALLVAAITAVDVGAMDSIEKTQSDVETSVCGFLREPFAFWSFQLTAGAPDAKRIRTIPRIERLSFTTRDGRSLGGYKLRAVVPWGYLLVAQGNAMLADQIIGELQFFRDVGLDVYIYDYRGYGLSEGVVPAAEIEEMAREAQNRGAAVSKHPEFAHPFQDFSVETHRRRFHEVADFLTRWRP